MREKTTTLERLPGPSVDVDVGLDGRWVSVCRGRADFVVVTAAHQFPAPPGLDFPFVRWLENGDLLIFDRRTAPGRPNAFVLTGAGVERARFCAGDGIEDVVAIGDRLVFAYFDEGIFGDVPPSGAGLAVFTPTGEVDFGYTHGVRDSIEVDDCNCACAGGRDEVCVVVFGDNPALVRLDITTRRQEVHALPGELMSANAVSTDGVSFFLQCHGPRASTRPTRPIFQWTPPAAPVPIGTYPGRLRGHFQGAFLAGAPAQYTIVTPAPAR